MPSKFLVVFEDIWHNKESHFTNKIGTTIREIMKSHNLEAEDISEERLKRYDSPDPYDKGTFSLGFYDVDLVKDEEYEGRIMIFGIQGAVE